ncbi:UNVERIFIED_ORG: hypothetical protein BDU10_2501 [Burkholderia sp. CF145]
MKLYPAWSGIGLCVENRHSVERQRHRWARQLLRWSGAWTSVVETDWPSGYRSFLFVNHDMVKKQPTERNRQENMDQGDSSRIVISRGYLQDARCEELSSSTRLNCAWEAMYFCCCEFAAGRGRDVDGLEHPDASVVEQLLRVLSLSAGESALVEALFRWSSCRHALIPEPCSLEEACAVAEHVHSQTVALLAAMKTRTK